MIRLASRSEIATRSIRRTWAARGLAGRREARRCDWRWRASSPRAGTTARSVLHLAELVADHQLLDRGELAGVGDRFDEVAVAGIGRDAARARVGMGQQARALEVREDVPDGRARDAETVALDQRLGPDRGRGCHVFVDDGAQDRFGAAIQRADGAGASRHGSASGDASSGARAVSLGVSTRGG